MRIVSADSAAAILDDKFAPVTLIASASVLVESPYREGHIRLAEAIFREVESTLDAVVYELELCQNLLETVKADVVHLDSSLGAFPVDELSPVELANLKISNKARTNLLRILPKMRKIAGEIRRKHNIEVLAIGKESMPVRIAELTAGAEAILFAGAKVAEEGKPLLIGLPMKCQHVIANDRVYLQSLIEAEHDIRGYAQDANLTLSKLSLTEFPNPVARGFRVIKMTPREAELTTTQKVQPHR